MHNNFFMVIYTSVYCILLESFHQAFLAIVLLLLLYSVQLVKEILGDKGSMNDRMIPSKSIPSKSIPLYIRILLIYLCQNCLPSLSQKPRSAWPSVRSGCLPRGSGFPFSRLRLILTGEHKRELEIAFSSSSGSCVIPSLWQWEGYHLSSTWDEIVSSMGLVHR